MDKTKGQNVPNSQKERPCIINQLIHVKILSLVHTVYLNQNLMQKYSCICNADSNFLLVAGREGWLWPFVILYRKGARGKWWWAAAYPSSSVVQCAVV